jgi:hypothetical protein
MKFRTFEEWLITEKRDESGEWHWKCNKCDELEQKDLASGKRDKLSYGICSRCREKGEKGMMKMQRYRGADRGFASGRRIIRKPEPLA